MTDFNEIIECKCGCGEMIHRWHQKTYQNGAKNGVREVKCLNGHGRKNKPTTEEHREKLSISQKDVPRPYASEKLKGRVFPHMVGANCNWYIDGRTPKNRLERVSKRTERWRDEIFRLFDYTCQLCQVRSGDGFKVILNAHHIYPWAKYPEKRWDLYNGICLCESCHNFTKGNEEAWIPVFANIVNGVNCWNTLTDNAEGNQQPSQNGDILEGSTTNSRDFYEVSNADTSAPAERRDIV